MRRPLVIVPLALAASLTLAGCETPGSTGQAATTTSAAVAPSDAPSASSQPSTDASTTAACSPGALQTAAAGRLTVATGSPAAEPWFSADKPSNGKGFESAVAYAVAQQLGYGKGQVRWVTATLDSIIAKTPKKYDFAIDEVSITQSRKKSVDFSPAYYDVAQAVVVLKTDKFAKAAGTDALHGARLGARAGSTSVDTIKNQIRPAAAALTYPAYDLAEQALTKGQIDGLVVELPTALHLVAGKVPNAVIVGQLPVVGAPEQFGLVLAKNSPLTLCVSKALTALDHSGTLADLTTTWLTTAAGVPVLH